MNEHRALREVSSRLAKNGVARNAGPSLDASMEKAATALREAVLAEVPAFSASGNPEILPSLAAHAGEHIQEIRRLFGGGEIGDFQFVRAHAQRRAEQYFPLEAILHAYRCGHRILSHWLRDAVVAAQPASIENAISAVADFAIEYTNTISTIMAAEYVAQTRILAEAEGDRRTELLNILLSGYDESDAKSARLLKRAGYLEQRHSYCVVVAQSTNPAEMELPDRAQRIANAISAAVATTPIRMLVGVRNSVVIAVLSDVRRQSGWTAPQTNLALRLHPLLLGLGPAVLIGASTDKPSTSFLPRALQEATIALDFASVTRSGRAIRRAPSQEPDAASWRRICPVRGSAVDLIVRRCGRESQGLAHPHIAGARRYRLECARSRTPARRTSEHGLFAHRPHKRTQRTRRPTSPRLGRAAAGGRLLAALI